MILICVIVKAKITLFTQVLLTELPANQSGSWLTNLPQSQSKLKECRAPCTSLKTCPGAHFCLATASGHGDGHEAFHVWAQLSGFSHPDCLSFYQLLS